MSIPIIYEDNHLLIVEKPTNMPVQEDASGDLDLLNWLKQDLKERYNKPGNVYLGLVHRLDRPVGGTMVFAKTSKAASRLSNAFRKREIDRVYFAVVYGHLKKDHGKLTHHLWKDRQKNIVHAVDPSHKDGKKAILNYQLVGESDTHSLLKVELETGRSHQIRVQLSEIGHPIYGDQKYGGKQVQPNTQIALWASDLTLAHPTKKTQMTFTSLPPQDNFPWSQFNL